MIASVAYNLSQKIVFIAVSAASQRKPIQLPANFGIDGMRSHGGASPQYI
jgi:hypothetical protein